MCKHNRGSSKSRSRTNSTTSHSKSRSRSKSLPGIRKRSKSTSPSKQNTSSNQRKCIHNQKYGKLSKSSSRGLSHPNICVLVMMKGNKYIMYRNGAIRKVKVCSDHH